MIAGGGFAGSALARKLGALASVTVVSMDNFLLFTPMLAEAAIGDVDPRHIVTPVRQLAPHAALVQGEITGIDPEHKTVTVQPLFGTGPVTVEGDILVIAVGSVPHTYGVTGADQHALSFKGISDALRVRNRVLALFEGASRDRDPWLTRPVWGRDTPEPTGRGLGDLSEATSGSTRCADARGHPGRCQNEGNPGMSTSHPPRAGGIESGASSSLSDRPSPVRTGVKPQGRCDRAATV